MYNTHGIESMKTPVGEWVPKTCKTVEQGVKPTEMCMEEDIASLLQKCLTMKPVCEDREKEYKRVQVIKINFIKKKKTFF